MIWSYIVKRFGNKLILRRENPIPDYVNQTTFQSIYSKSKVWETNCWFKKDRVSMLYPRIKIWKISIPKLFFRSGFLFSFNRVFIMKKLMSLHFKNPKLNRNEIWELEIWDYFLIINSNNTFCLTKNIHDIYIFLSLYKFFFLILFYLWNCKQFIQYVCKYIRNLFVKNIKNEWKIRQQKNYNNYTVRKHAVIPSGCIGGYIY